MEHISQQTHQFLKSKTGQMVLGLILGDGTVRPYRFEHSQRSLYWEYSKHISQEFQNEYPQLLTPKIKTHYYYIKQRVNPESLTTYTSQTFYTKRHPIWKELYSMFYPNGIKIIPINLIQEYFTKRSLFYLYLDDGRVARYAYSGLSLCLCAFNITELNDFRSFLLKYFELETSIHQYKQYPVIYVKMSSSKQLIYEFLQLIETVNSIGLIGQIKLQFKKVLLYQTPKLDTLPNLKLNSIHLNLLEPALTEKNNQLLMLVGVLQGFIVGGANFRWNKDYQTGYLRLRLKNATSFSDWVLTVLKQTQLKITSTGTNLQIGVKIDNILNEYVKEVVNSEGLVKDLSQLCCIQNTWFWRTLFLYKGTNLKHQRGGFLIRLNHLEGEDVIKISNAFNNFYGFESSVRYRANTEKPSIYIPVKNRNKFCQLANIDIR